MQVTRISDLDHPMLQDFRALTDVRLRKMIEPHGGLYIAESTKIIQRALAAGHQPRSVLLQQKWLDELAPMVADFDVPIFVGEPALLNSLTGYNVHRGALASMHRPELPGADRLLTSARRVVILEDIVDHTNVGAIFRAVAGLGADAVLVTERCADPLYRRSIRVSMGAVFQVPWTRLPDWPRSAGLLTAHGFHIAALALAPGAIPLDEFAVNLPERVAVLLGTEGDGLSRSAIRDADTVVTIPMLNGVDSLNVASASAIALWTLRVTPSIAP